MSTNMKMADFRKLKGMMERTTSDSDAEALTAIRMANRLLAGYGISWGRVFERLVHVDNEVEQAPEDYGAQERRLSDAEIEADLQAVEATNPKGEFGDFVQSIREQWDTKRDLSPRQREALRKSARRARGGRFR
jgi:hypothetical protein